MGIFPGAPQSIEKNFKRMKQEARSDIQEEVQRLETQTTDGLVDMQNQLIQRICVHIQEVVTPAVVQGGTQG
eukprot:snap_masked-scaffold_81-processed-gene-0.12-mRNA-1 protein AED:1.00 eAED:1.00 QI:0/-1/0/0/-1/1/1/0/71